MSNTAGFRVLRPGILVSLKSKARGNTRYHKRDLEYAHLTENGTQVSRWDTTKTVYDPDEQKEASRVVSSASYLIRKLCIESEHGLLCPVERADELNEAIAEAREMVASFNATSRYTTVEVNVICGQVVADDMNTTRAIFSETEQFMEAMQRGLEELDVKKVRYLMKKAKDVGQMLAPDTSQTVAIAVNAASAACKKIVKAGNQAAIAIDQNAIDTIGLARNSFLDFDFDGTDVQVEAPAPILRAIDFEEEVGGYAV